MQLTNIDFSFPVIFNLIVGIFLFLNMFIISVFSLVEKEKRAFWISIILMFVTPLAFFLLAITNFPYQSILVYVLIGIIFLLLLVFVLLFGKNIKAINDIPKSRFDERDVVFSRNKLIKGEKNYLEYYKANPSKKKIDDSIRSLPGLLSPKASKYNKQLFEKADYYFSKTEELYPLVDGTVAKEKKNIKIENSTKAIKQKILEQGAVSVGITELKDYHLYSNKGRGGKYGEEIKKTHKIAIAFTVEMDRDLNRAAPEAPTVVESARQYFNAGKIATSIAENIRKMGFSAKAHIDGNYELICPLVARDAGLGEIGRMSILITPKLGPRVRIGVITTDLPLMKDNRIQDLSVIDFCTKCNKCAKVCPVNAIPLGAIKDINGVMKWKLKEDACFAYWNTIGTDCGICMATCPYSHPNNFFHRFIRKGIEKSSLFRSIATPLDDLFYGKNPKFYKSIN
ncbi:MAG: reductive dehalogenase domain-containing protein [Bacteroidota bacterium]|nr:reductive dehalogenase domain-containing protein [Bacteroidota bacterium]